MNTQINGSHEEGEGYGVAAGADCVRLTRILPGPLQRVWNHLVDPELRRQWLADGAIEPRVGGRVEHVFRNSSLTPDDDEAPAKYAAQAHEARLEGRVTCWDPPHTLAYTWGCDAAPSEVTFELTALGDRVQMVITHRRLESHDALLSVASRWHAHADILQARLEGRMPQGFWRNHTRLEAEYATRLQG